MVMKSIKIHLEEKMLNDLQAIAKTEMRPRAYIIREAIQRYIYRYEIEKENLYKKYKKNE